MGRIPHRPLFGSAPRPEDERAVTTAMEQTGVTHLADRLVGELSDGERQRVLVARALAQEPRILLLDEPAAHVDPPHQTALFQLLKCLVEDEVVESVILATHHLHLALHLADTLVLVAQRAVAWGAPNTLVDTGALERAFLGHEGSVSAAHTHLDREKGWFVPTKTSG